MIMEYFRLSEWQKTLPKLNCNYLFLPKLAQKSVDFGNHEKPQWFPGTKCCIIFVYITGWFCWFSKGTSVHPKKHFIYSFAISGKAWCAKLKASFPPGNDRKPLIANQPWPPSNRLGGFPIVKQVLLQLANFILLYWMCCILPKRGKLEVQYFAAYFTNIIWRSIYWVRKMNWSPTVPDTHDWAGVTSPHRQYFKKWSQAKLPHENTLLKNKGDQMVFVNRSLKQKETRAAQNHPIHPTFWLRCWKQETTNN